MAATTFHEYFRSRRIGCVWQCVFGNDGIPCFDQELSAGDEPVGNISGYGFRNGDDSRNSVGTYIGMLAGGDPVSRVLFAKHLLSASLIGCSGFYCSG